MNKESRSFNILAKRQSCFIGAAIALLFAVGVAQAQSPTGPVITGGDYAID